MANNFTEKQISELDIASQRKARGEATPIDTSNLNYAISRGYSYTPKTPQAELADALGDNNKTPFELGTGIEGYDAALAAEKESTNINTETTDKAEVGDYLAGDRSISEFINEAFGEVPQVEVEGLEDEKLRLESSRDEQIKALDLQYAQNLSDLQQKNKNIGNELKAKLIKLGISPSDSAWSNAEAGQIERDRQAEARLRNEYNINKAAIMSQSDQAITNLAVTENQQKFNAQVQNINNLLQKQGQGISLFNIFAQRDDAQKAREQSAYNALMDYQQKMVALDADKQQKIAENILKNAQEGYYNIEDESTAKMLADLEKQYPEYLQGITGVATQGLSDRLMDMATKEMDITYKQALIDKTRSDIAKAAADAAGDGGLSKEEKAFYDDVDKQLTKLAEGDTDWGTAFSTIKSKYGAPDNLIDTLLNKEIWAEPGAYEKIQERRSGSDYGTTGYYMMPIPSAE